jgi:hypothetical protein
MIQPARGDHQNIDMKMSRQSSSGISKDETEVFGVKEGEYRVFVMLLINLRPKAGKLGGLAVRQYAIQIFMSASSGNGQWEFECQMAILLDETSKQIVLGW